MALNLGVPCPTCGCVENSCASCTNSISCSNCVDCCCSAVHSAWRLGRIRSGLRLEYLSSAWMGVEVVASVGIGIVSGSLALVAFGSDSLVEILSGLATVQHLRNDIGGSGSTGRRTAKLNSFLLFALLPLLVVGAGYSYIVGVRPEGSLLGIVLALAAVAVMPYLWFRKRRIGEETNCVSLKIDAVESATCFFMSLALLGGLLIEFLFGFWWADYLATGVILAFVGKEAYESFNEAKGLPLRSI